MIKSGIGYDVHSLAKGEELIIGGVKINSPRVLSVIPTGMYYCTP